MVTVGRVRAEDWQRLREVRLRALADSPTAFASTLDSERARPEEAWRDWATRPDFATFFAELDGEWVGLCSVAVDPQERSQANLFAMWTAPPHRGRGIARRLLAAALEWASERGASAAALEVTETNLAARRFYLAAGFAETANLRPLRSHPTLRTVEMRKDLRR